MKNVLTKYHKIYNGFGASGSYKLKTHVLL